MALPFIQYVPQGVEGLKSGINFMDNLRTKGEEIEAAAQERQYNEERLRAMRTAGLNPPGSPSVAPGLNYSPFSTNPQLAPVPPEMQGTAKVPGTFPILGVPAAPPAAPPVAPTEDATGKPPPPATTTPVAPGPSQVGKVENTLGIGVVGPTEYGIGPSIRGVMADADFQGVYSGMRTKWATGAYGNPMATPAGYVYGFLTNEGTEGKASRDKSAEVLSWLDKPETQQFFAGNLKALEEAVKDPAAAFTKYGTVSTTPAPAPAPGTTPAPAPAPAPGTTPAPAPAPAADATVVNNKGETVAAKPGVTPPAPQPAPVAPAGVPSNRVDGLIAVSATNLQTDKSRAVIGRAAQLGVDPAFAATVWGLETSFGTDVRTSSAGAISDMQIKPDKDGGYWAQKHFSDPKIMAQYVQSGKLTQAQADTLLAAAQNAKIGTEQGNIDLGLLAIKYNELNVPPSLWGAAYNASADKIIARGKPFEGENAQYNTDFTVLYNHFAGLLNTGKEIAGVSPQIEGAPDAVTAALTRNPAVLNREIQATVSSRDALYATTAKSREILDQKYTVDYQNASFAVREAEIKRDAALKAGNVAKLDEATKELRTAQGALAAVQANYQNNAATLQVTLSSEIQKIDATLVDQMTQVATRDLVFNKDPESFRRTWKAATLSDIYLQPTNQTVTTASGRTEKQYVVYLPSSDGSWKNVGLKSETDLVRELNAASSSVKFTAYQAADAKTAEALREERAAINKVKVEQAGKILEQQLKNAGDKETKAMEVNGIKFTNLQDGTFGVSYGGRAYVYNPNPPVNENGVAASKLTEIQFDQGSLAPGLLPPGSLSQNQ